MKTAHVQTGGTQQKHYFKGKCIALYTFIRKQGRLKKTGAKHSTGNTGKGAAESTERNKKDIITIRAEINEIPNN